MNGWMDECKFEIVFIVSRQMYGWWMNGWMHKCKFEIVVVVSQMYVWMDRRMNG